ncbi:MAG: prolyl oligopeptidase family serine peptidase [Actinomycetota bacterium]|nr:prolyl oligopeptidase family serine peptidase [Actinomycetota bacterium]
MSAPKAPVHQHVHDQHGVKRPDPYAWLADKLSEESVAYLNAERAHYDSAVAPLAPLAQKLYDEMSGRVLPEDESVHWREGAFEYFTRTLAGKEYPQLCRVTTGGAVEVLLDENLLAGDSGFVEVGVREVSPDGRLLAYSVDLHGEEVYELRFRDLTTGEDLPETAAHTYYSGAWSADSSVFFYVVHDDLYRPYQVWRHRIGTPPGQDVLVLEDADEQFDVAVRACRSGELVVIRTFNRITTEEWLVDARRPEEPARVVQPREPGVEYTVEHLAGTNGGRLLIVTNVDATEYRLVDAPLSSPGRDHWRPLVAEHPTERMVSADAFADHVVVTLVSQARRILRVFPVGALGASDAGLRTQDIEARSAAGIVELSHNEEYGVTRVLVEEQSYAAPPRWFQVDLATGDRTLVKQTVLPGYDEGRYVSERHWVDARDGEQVPVTLVRHSSTPLNGTAPVLLYGYGAYEYEFEPHFDPVLASLLDRGVVFAHAHIRGGGAMGRRWWLDGRMQRKLNTFHDFIDVADSLDRDGLVDGARIVSRGLSAGGLLQGAVFSMRPDRWRAVVAEVPFVDVVNTMFRLDIPLTANELDEWGDPRREEDFRYLLGYSPYDNVPAGPWPELLVTGALHDPRVMVHEPAKWVARLRSVDDGAGGRVLFRVETGDGGHSGPVGRYSHLHYEAEVAAFILDAMGLA